MVALALVATRDYLTKYRAELTAYKDYVLREQGRDLGELVKVYPYRDIDGTLRYVVARWKGDQGKTFSQHHLKAGKLRAGLGDVEPLPLNLPDVIEASCDGNDILGVEGEKDADNLTALGFTATCNSGGAGNWKPELNKYFNGARVVLIPDNDAPGRDHVAKVAQQLHQAGGTVRILELPSLPEKGDVSDWLAMGNTADDLQTLIASAVTYAPGSLDHWLKVKEVKPVSTTKTRTKKQVRAGSIEAAKDEIKRRIDCFEYMRSIAGDPDSTNRDGGKWKSPTRAERTASFQVYAGDRGYCDFGDGKASGDIFALDMLLHGCQFSDSLKRLAQYANVTLPESRSVSRRAIPISDSDLDAVQWPDDMPAAIEAIWLAFKLCLSVLCLLRLVLKAVATGQLEANKLTVKGIAAETGMTERQVYNALEKDRGVFFTIIPFFADDLSLSISKEDSESDTDKAKGKKRNNSKVGAPDRVFALHPAPVAVRNIIRHCVTAKATQKLFPNLNPDRLAQADPDLVKAAGLNEPGALEMLQKYLVYPAGNAKALQQLADWITQARFRLSNLAPDPLPELPDGKPIVNGKRYRAAIVARRAVLKHDGGELSIKQVAKDTGISERLIPELYTLGGVYNDTDNYTSVQINAASELPAPGYSFELQGAPVKVKIIDNDGTITPLPYTEYDPVSKQTIVKPETRQVMAAALAKGEHVYVLAQRAGKPRPATEAEYEQAMLDREAQRRKRAEANKDKPKAERRKSAGSGLSRNDTPGYSDSFAMGWRNRLIEYLASGAPDELLIMLTGGDTSQVVDFTGQIEAKSRHVDGGTLVNFPAPAPVAQPAEPAPIQLDFFTRKQNLPLARVTDEMYTTREQFEEMNLIKPNTYVRARENNLNLHESQAAQDLKRWQSLDWAARDSFVDELKECDPARYRAMIEMRAAI